MDKIKLTKTSDVPLTQQSRIKAIQKLPLKQKTEFVPPPGTELRIGPYVYEVSVTNASQLRFTAVLKDVIIDGVNGSAQGRIITPSDMDGIR